MSAVNSATTQTAAPPRPAAMANGTSPSAVPVPAAAAAAPPQLNKKTKKKALDSNEASKLVAARISQLELDQAGDKEQEIEIGT